MSNAEGRAGFWQRLAGRLGGRRLYTRRDLDNAQRAMAARLRLVEQTLAGVEARQGVDWPALCQRVWKLEEQGREVERQLKQPPGVNTVNTLAQRVLMLADREATHVVNAQVMIERLGAIGEELRFLQARVSVLAGSPVAPPNPDEWGAALRQYLDSLADPFAAHDAAGQWKPALHAYINNLSQAESRFLDVLVKRVNALEGKVENVAGESPFDLMGRVTRVEGICGDLARRLEVPGELTLEGISAYWLAFLNSQATDEKDSAADLAALQVEAERLHTETMARVDEPHDVMVAMLAILVKAIQQAHYAAEREVELALRATALEAQAKGLMAAEAKRQGEL